MSEILCDVAAERAVLAGLCKYGSDAYYEVVDIVKENTFTQDSNRVMFKCIKSVLDKHEDAIVDVPTILSAASELGLSYHFDKKTEQQYLASVFNFPVNSNNLKRFAAKIRKLEIARTKREQLLLAADKYLEVRGDERASEILSIAENAVYDNDTLLNDGNNVPKRMGDNLLSYVTYLGENPVRQIGVQTGLKNYDKAIGGGLRGGTINVIAARPKTGKTLLSDNMGYHIANTERIPVLNMDTEMKIEDHIHRSLAMITDCYIHDIESGQYYVKEEHKDKVLEAAKKWQESQIPYYHISIAGMSFDEQFAVMRNWIRKVPGVNTDGKANKCVIIYDYLKLMDSKEISGSMAEFQALGFMMSNLHNFAVKYDIPILAFMQLNRDGISKETTDTASGSDRIVWLCSNFTIFKRKSDEEIQQDGIKNGNRKLVPVIARHGEWDDRNYICLDLKGYCAKITEGKTKNEIMEDSGVDQGFELEDQETSVEF